MSAADVFFDTNVILCLLSGDAAKADAAERLVASGGVISVQVLNEFAAVAARKLGMQIGEIRTILATVRAVCTVKPVELETHELGLDLAERYRLPICDALIVAAATLAGCSIVYSENFHRNQRIGRLTVRNPFIGHASG
jgi:predicted nucleic acid-binding protein